MPASKKNKFLFLNILIIGSISSSVSGLGIKDLWSTWKSLLWNSFFLRIYATGSCLDLLAINVLNLSKFLLDTPYLFVSNFSLGIFKILERINSESSL